MVGVVVWWMGTWYGVLFWTCPREVDDGMEVKGLVASTNSGKERCRE